MLSIALRFVYLIGYVWYSSLLYDYEWFAHNLVVLHAYTVLTCLCQSLKSSEMGKNKGGKNKVNAVFRVAGGKAAKAKAKFKAQPVATNLKKVYHSITLIVFNHKLSLLLLKNKCFIYQQISFQLLAKLSPIKTDFFFLNFQLNTKSRSTVEDLDRDLVQVRDILESGPPKKEVKEPQVKEIKHHDPADIDQAINDLASL